MLLGSRNSIVNADVITKITPFILLNSVEPCFQNDAAQANVIKPIMV